MPRLSSWFFNLTVSSWFEVCRKAFYLPREVFQLAYRNIHLTVNWCHLYNQQRFARRFPLLPCFAINSISLVLFHIQGVMVLPLLADSMRILSRVCPRLYGGVSPEEPFTIRWLGLHNETPCLNISLYIMLNTYANNNANDNARFICKIVSSIIIQNSINLLYRDHYSRTFAF